MNIRAARCALAALAFGVASVVAAGSSASAAPRGHVAASLLSEAASIEPGRPFWVAIELRHDEHWHTYWKNPGDSGLATQIEWALPAGFRAGEIQWPFPGHIDDGPLTSYGYTGRTLLPVEVTPAADAAPGPVKLAGHVSWLECADICVPGSADVSLTVPVKPGGGAPLDEKRAPEFAEWRARLPLDGAALGYSFAGRFDDATLEVDVTPPAWMTSGVGSAELYPASAEVIQHAAAQQWKEDTKPFQIRAPRTTAFDTTPTQLAGVLVSANGWRGAGSERAIAFDVPLARSAAALAPVTPGAAAAAGPGAATSVAAGPATRVHASDASATPGAATAGAALSLPAALVFALLGGLILNLMPCVFPVLSLKVLGFVQQAHHHRRVAIEHALVFAVGVLVSFWVLAGALIALRAGGAMLGWGFQLQSPPFVVALAALFFAMALNLFDVFEISGAAVTSKASSASARAGWMGSFLSGCLATVVATPCTAPFMGAALGFALAQPAWVALAIFTALGVGMALPYVVLVSSPHLMRLIPRPGEWMNSVRHAMGFLLLATVVWLAWVLGKQAGNDAVITLLGSLWVIGVGLWIAGRWGSIVASDTSRLVSRFAAVALSALGLWFAISHIDPECSAASPDSPACQIRAPAQTRKPVQEGSTTWEPWSEERVAQALAAGQHVLVDATAAWCLSCQVNEKVALSTSAVQAALADKGVVTLRADWTHRDEKITRWLGSFGRAGVPLYVLYGVNPGGREPETVVLPAVLTPQIVLDALARLS
ncbi:MAG: thioredoxin family protein [Deltaproteobacteria bacterium]|nr:thioredoxin family protein [Deltaproteobacteria bacterium]